MSQTTSQPRQFSSLGLQLGQRLKERGLTVSCAESLTGGTIASMIAQIAGSSAYFMGSVTSYAVSVKQEVLGVDVSEGVVSQSTARQMALGVSRLLRSDCAVATTGIAGPGGAEPGKPVGTVCIAAMIRDLRPLSVTSATTDAVGVETPSAARVISRIYHFEGDREAVILQSADAALQLLLEILA